nr:retrovirus-related Pol polyprotein from transposon TNT 1-94 [Tanacetum cinerariifolium]
MLIFSRAPLFLWAEAIATACFTQNRSIIHRLFNKTPYELINGRKPDISFLHVFSALYYPKNDREDIGKLGAKGDIDFSLASARTVPPAQEPQVRQTSTASITIADTTPTPTNSSSLATNISITSEDIDELNLNAMVDGNTFVNPFANPSTSAAESLSLQNVDPSNMHTNRTLVEAARTMLIFSRAPLFLWAEAIATACFTQNRSIIHRRFNKTPYELINGRKPDISFLHVFGALCYPKNDREDIGKLGAKGDIGFFIGYSADSCAYRIYNRRTKKIMETMNVSFDELLAMAFEQRSSKPRLQSMTPGQISSRLDLTYVPSTITTQQPSEGELDLLFEAMYDVYIGGQPSATARTVPDAQEP